MADNMSLTDNDKLIQTEVNYGFHDNVTFPGWKHNDDMGPISEYSLNT